MNFFDRLFSYFGSTAAGPGRPLPGVPPLPPNPPLSAQHSKPYTMAILDGENAEITMYGEIVDAQPVDWWTGEPIEGSYIIQGEFLKDLEDIAGTKALTIRMDSVGGDAGVSILIHNRLRELSAKGTKLECIVDGVAMSGGSLVMCACDTVRVNPSSLVMIHKCWSSLFGGYNSDELREMAARNDAWDKAQVSIYKRKCGLSDTVISNMMAKTTYMTGAEAVEKGFADEVLEDAEPLDIAASADGRSLFVRGRPFHLTPGMFAPDNIPTVTPEAAASETNTNQNGGTTMANTLEELRVENPALAEQLLAEARAAVSASGTAAPALAEVCAALAASAAPPVKAAAAAAMAADQTCDAAQAERQRIQEIDALAGLYDAETIQAAKYGEHACTAQEMAYRAAQKAAQQGKKFLSDMSDDAQASGAQAVPACGDPGTPPPKENQTQEQRIAYARAEVKALFGKEGK
ncbi:MAG: Clp protease ClpP [Oscillospiraceae bacterium]|nr:Clp protease ClpP [Oscillospiraceae bacterium]